MEKASGIIASDDLLFPVRSFSDIADCGDYPRGIPTKAEGSLNVFAAARGEDRATVTVNTRFQMMLRYEGGLLGTRTRYVPRNSIGSLEASILDRISTGLNFPTAEFRQPNDG